jgi:Zinc carboxypeptidase
MNWEDLDIFLTITDSASGVSVDHAYGEHKIPVGYTYEMRGSGAYGNYGFFLPPRFIIENAEEVLASLVGLVQRARDLGYLIQAP